MTGQHRRADPVDLPTATVMLSTSDQDALKKMLIALVGAWSPLYRLWSLVIGHPHLVALALTDERRQRLTDWLRSLATVIDDAPKRAS